MKKIVWMASAIAIMTGSILSVYGAGSPGANGHLYHERHPEIQHAIVELNEAKSDLKHADSDYGGHRSKSLAHVAAALWELHLALEQDEREGK